MANDLDKASFLAAIQWLEPIHGANVLMLTRYVRAAIRFNICTIDDANDLYAAYQRGMNAAEGKPADYLPAGYQQHVARFRYELRRLIRDEEHTRSLG